MAVIKIKNPDVSKNIKTFLSQEYTSGATLNVDSSVGFVNGNYVSFLFHWQHVGVA